MISEERMDELDEMAEERGSDDADSLYPLREEDEELLQRFGLLIAKEYEITNEEEALFFAASYRSGYQNEIACLDRDGCLEYYRGNDDDNDDAEESSPSQEEGDKVEG